jgi:hypothetical protein
MLIQFLPRGEKMSRGIQGELKRREMIHTNPDRTQQRRNLYIPTTCTRTRARISSRNGDRRTIGQVGVAVPIGSSISEPTKAMKEPNQIKDGCESERMSPKLS